MKLIHERAFITPQSRSVQAGIILTYGLHHNGPLVNFNDNDVPVQQYSKLVIKGFTLNMKTRKDRFCTTLDGTIVEVKNVIKIGDDYHVIGLQHHGKGVFFCTLVSLHF